MASLAGHQASHGFAKANVCLCVDDGGGGVVLCGAYHLANRPRPRQVRQRQSERQTCKRLAAIEAQSEERARQVAELQSVLKRQDPGAGL